MSAYVLGMQYGPASKKFLQKTQLNSYFQAESILPSLVLVAITTRKFSLRVPFMQWLKRALISSSSAHVC